MFSGLTVSGLTVGILPSFSKNQIDSCSYVTERCNNSLEFVRIPSLKPLEMSITDLDLMICLLLYDC